MRLRPFWAVTPWLLVLGSTVMADQHRLYDPSRPPEDFFVEMAAPEESPSEPSFGADQQKWKLNMVRLGGKEALAMINGHIVRPGGTIDGLQITEITLRGVSGLAKSKPVHLQMTALSDGLGLTIRPHATPTATP
ncbi:MAG: hypothetical protein HQL07_00290 [Nitrospirae bacterium]|nr:hypothetical protein [Magnetococcales bacterium]HAT49621.1 hypothetical protein [Alphaproteobacteria bacterium]